MDFMLPINDGDSPTMDVYAAQALGRQYAPQYQQAAPYPHIVIDSFLPMQFASKIREKFPDQVLKNDKFYENKFGGYHKRQILPADCDATTQDIFRFFNSAPVLQFLEQLTGISGLIPDPYFSGGGFHEISHGGKLGIHADFRINEQLHLQRRLNLLIYLNQDWHEDYGGHLEIWNTDMSTVAKRILPIFNRCVIFNTDAQSYHGHPEPLKTPDNISRKSLALYYYTASTGVYDEVPGYSTMYVGRPGDSGTFKLKTWRRRMLNHLRDWIPPAIMRAIR